MKASEGGGGCCSGRSKRSKSAKDEIAVKKQGTTSGDIFNAASNQ